MVRAALRHVDDRILQVNHSLWVPESTHPPRRLANEPQRGLRRDSGALGFRVPKTGQLSSGRGAVRAGGYDARYSRGLRCGRCSLPTSSRDDARYSRGLRSGRCSLPTSSRDDAAARRRHAHQQSRLVGRSTLAGGFEHPAATDSATFNGVDRRTSTLPHAQPIHGFFRGPRMEEISRPPTVKEVLEHELEIIQHIDRDGCMLGLCCEIGGEPERYLEYHLRVVMCLRDLHKMVGDSSALLWRYDAAFRKGLVFKGNSMMCAKVYKRCS